MENYDETKFFDKEMTKSYMKSQVSFLKRTEKNFYEFKLIEIVNEREVKEHMTFVHPFYEDKKRQFLYISNDCKMMFEILNNGRYFLYQKEAGKVDGTNKITWKQIHRFQSFPDDLLKLSQNPFILSRDFSMYLDVDRKNRRFMIKDSMT